MVSARDSNPGTLPPSTENYQRAEFFLLNSGKPTFLASEVKNEGKQFKVNSGAEFFEIFWQVLQQKRKKLDDMIKTGPNLHINEIFCQVRNLSIKH